MVGRKLITLTVLACAGALVAVLSSHLWGRYLQATEALEFGKTYDRYQPPQTSADDAPIWRAGVREASAPEEWSRAGRRTRRRKAGRHDAWPPADAAAPACAAYCGRSSVMVNHRALKPTKMCLLGRMVGSSTRLPMATWTKAPSRTTE